MTRSRSFSLKRSGARLMSNINRSRHRQRQGLVCLFDQTASVPLFPQNLVSEAGFRPTVENGFQ
jgi:hypothetical protein